MADDARLISEFKESMNLSTCSDMLESDLRCKESFPHRINFSSDVKTLRKRIQVNIYLQTNKMSINNSEVMADVVFSTAKVMEDKGEKFISSFLISFATK